jgi:hypothetical protein
MAGEIDGAFLRADPALALSWLRHARGLPEDDPALLVAKNNLANSRLINRVLRKENPDGSWDRPESLYFPKYRSSYWQFILLGHLGATADLAGVKRAAIFIKGLQEEDGSWSAYPHARGLEAEYEHYSRGCARKGKEPDDFKEWSAETARENEMSCLTGNVAATLIRIGLAGTETVSKALDWLAGVQFTDGGWKCPFWRAHLRDRHSCFMGTACAAEALALCPARTRPHQEALDRACEFLLMHRLFRADHHDFQVIKPRWLEISYPWRVDYNFLRGLYVLSLAGRVDERAGEAIQLLISKRRPDGFWASESRGVGLEKKGEPSLWTTLKATETLRRLDSVNRGG